MFHIQLYVHLHNYLMPNFFILGNFVIIEPIVEGVKVKGEIVRVLLKDKIKYFQDQGVW